MTPSLYDRSNPDPAYTVSMYFIVIASISDAGLVSSGQIMFLPKGINFKAYEQLKNYESIWIGYRNTILYVIVGTIVTLGREHSGILCAVEKKTIWKRRVYRVLSDPDVLHRRSDPDIPGSNSSLICWIPSG